MTPPSNTPPNVPGSSNMPPPNLPGASGGYQSMPSSTPPPQKSSGLFTQRNIIIGVVALVLLCCCCGIFALVGYNFINNTASSITSTLGTIVPEQGKVAIVGTTFLTSLKNGDWAGAYSICTPQLQKQLGNAAALGKKISDGRAQPVSWTFADFSSISPADQEAQIDGTVVLTGNKPGTLRLVFDRAGNSWQVSGFNLSPN